MNEIEQQVIGSNISELLLGTDELDSVQEKEIQYKGKTWIFGIRKCVAWIEKTDLQSSFVKPAPDGKGMVPSLVDGQLKVLQTYIKYIKLGNNIRPLQKTELMGLPDEVVEGLLEEIPITELMMGLSPELKKKFTT